MSFDACAKNRSVCMLINSDQIYACYRIVKSLVCSCVHIVVLRLSTLLPV